MLKRTNALSKDKIEALNTSFGRYELNNFYDNPETDCNGIMSKDQKNINFLIEENHLIRDTILKFYEITYKALQRNNQPPYPVMLNTAVFQKP